MNQLPIQAIPTSKKDTTWVKETVDAIIESSRFSLNGASSDNEIVKLYGYYSGQIDPSDYSYVTQPYGTQSGPMAARIRNYPLIKSSVDVMLGEKARRLFNYSIVVVNSDVVTKKSEARKNALAESISQMLINGLNQQGVDTGSQSEPVEPPKEVVRMFEMTYRDQRAIMAQKALNYIRWWCDLYDKVQTLWFDFLVAGVCASYRGVFSNEPYYEVLNPASLDWAKDATSDLLEDADWVVYKKYVHPSTIVKDYAEDLTDEMVLRLERPSGERGPNATGLSQVLADSPVATGSLLIRDYVKLDRLVEVFIVCWKSRRQIGIRSYIDPESGEMLQEIVQEGYKASQPDESVKWYWINEAWTAHRVDGDLVKYGPDAVQRYSSDNMSSCKLAINGIIYSNRNAQRISFVSLGIPFNLLYNIYNYRLENAVAKSKEVVANIDLNSIPDSLGLDKFLYYMDSMGIIFTETKEAGQSNPQHRTVLDLSIKTIEQYVGLLGFIRSEWEAVSGINRQRLGGFGQYEGKASGQQAIMQSSNVTEDYFRKFDMFEAKDMQALIDVSKAAWISGKKAQYVLPDGSLEILELDGIDFMEAEYGIHVSNNRKDQENLEMLRQLAMPMVQSGVPLSMIAEIISAESMSELKEMIKTAEDYMSQLEQQRSEAQGEQMQQAQDRQEALEHLKLQTQIEIAVIGAPDANIEEVNNRLKERELLIKEEIERRKLDLERNKLGETVRSNMADEAIKRVMANRKPTKS